MKRLVLMIIPALISVMRKNVFEYAKCLVILLIAAVFFSCEKQSSSVQTDDEDEGLHIEPIIPIVPLTDYSSIVFVGQFMDNSDDGSRSLYTMDKSGNNIRKIVDKTVGCQKPARSHCGTRLLFTHVKFDTWANPDNSVGMSSEYELYIVNTDGTALTLIDRIDRTKSGAFGNFDWSPDGKHIVYSKFTFYTDRIEDRDLILYNISDNTRTILQTQGQACTPKFSPDGKYIAYCTEVEGEIIIPSHNTHHVYIIDVAKKNNQLLIRNAASPVWSPQGDKIAYSSSGEAGSSQIFVANVDGRNKKQLTHTVSPIRYPGWAPDGNDDPQWTPDGKQIVYVSWENGRPGIFLMNADGSNQTRLTTAEYRDEHPEVTPDGKHILFSSRRSDMMNHGIVMMTLDGKNQKVLSKSGTFPVASR